MCSTKFLIFQLSVFCVLQICSGVGIVPSQQLPSELFKPINSKSGSTNSDTREQEVDNTPASNSNTNNSPQTFDTRQQSYTRPPQRVNQGFNAPIYGQDQDFNGPEIRRPNNFVVPGHLQQGPNIPDFNQNGYVHRTFTVPGTPNQPSYTVNTYQSPTYHQTWSWSSDGPDGFPSDGPIPPHIRNGFGVNDISFDDNFGDGFNNGPFGGDGQTITRRSGSHTIRTTGPDGRTTVKTTYW